MTKPEPGDRVRGTFEGVVVHGGRVRPVDDVWAIPLGLLHDVEILSPPKPEWQPSDVVIDRHGGVFVRTRDADTPWRWMANDREYAECYPVRPLRRARIVPEDGAS